MGLVESYFFKFFEKKHEKKSRKKNILVLQRPQRMRTFACLQDCLLTLTCHLAPMRLWMVATKYRPFRNCVNTGSRHMTVMKSTLTSPVTFRPAIDCEPVRSAPPKPCLSIVIVYLLLLHFALIHLECFPLFFPRSNRLPHCIL